ncbi:hypothetical protein EK0264_04690 [Epidermidibacterium keratini]|uniref:NADPH-dependent FMN reductase-like domain-containing protein n=1 Tax=Epidermidibacterium keratini TaxID=1891644 RepID=A0A7L4YK58_9ACTN|nr:NADPH-dependent FMN reductase [Epidermidibacterium keratini]QHB99650.1 hypothetical protein EK0264_04690 [Epidermidibacterium keratini]
MNLLVFIGSLRADSVTAKVAEFAIAQTPDDVHVRVWDQIAELPHYNEDFEGDDLPAVGSQLREAIAAADALLLVTPEYNGALPSGLKNVIDWASRPYGAAAIKGKPTGIIGTSRSSRAAQWSRENAARSLEIAGADVLPDTVGVGSHFETVTDQGPTDEATIAAIKSLLAHLQRAAEQTRSTASRG